MIPSPMKPQRTGKSRFLLEARAWYREPTALAPSGTIAKDLRTPGGVVAS
jgi:hypothetical protein